MYHTTYFGAGIFPSFDSRGYVPRTECNWKSVSFALFASSHRKHGGLFPRPRSYQVLRVLLYPYFRENTSSNFGSRRYIHLRFNARAYMCVCARVFVCRHMNWKPSTIYSTSLNPCLVISIDFSLLINVVFSFPDASNNFPYLLGLLGRPLSITEFLRKLLTI